MPTPESTESKVRVRRELCPRVRSQWEDDGVVIGREARRRARSGRAAREFGARSRAALDAFDLLELAWHDCFGVITPPDQVVEDVWTVADGDVARLVSAVHLAVLDFRDLRVRADAERAARAEGS